jgi:ectoine hydroxylase-related dioxygenase (phytanoyl-CoA dioxygenase family)
MKNLALAKNLDPFDTFEVFDAFDPSAIPWNELESKGYVVVPSFLTSAEIDVFRDDYDTAAKPGQPSRDRSATAKDAIDVPYKVRHPSTQARQVIDGKLAAVAKSVKHATGIRVNAHSAGPFGSLYFTTDGDIGLGWHQDSASYYAYQNHYDYLNFYIPIVKPARAKSNLSVVPFDALGARSPVLCQAIRGRGATRFVIKRGTTVVHDNDRGLRHAALPYALDELAVTPELDAGDLLLLRGDVIHRTQDTDTYRVALSLRMMNSRTRIRRSELVRGGLIKTVLMNQLRNEFQVLFDCFDAAGRDEMTLGKLVSLEASVSRFCRRPTQRDFLTFLFWAKFGALFSGPPTKPEKE